MNLQPSGSQFGVLLCPGDIWHCLQTFRVITTWRNGTIQPQMSAVPRLRNLVLTAQQLGWSRPLGPPSAGAFTRGLRPVALGLPGGGAGPGCSLSKADGRGAESGTHLTSDSCHDIQETPGRKKAPFPITSVHSSEIISVMPKAPQTLPPLQPFCLLPWGTIQNMTKSVYRLRASLHKQCLAHRNGILCSHFK